MVVNRAGDAGLPPEHWFWDESISGGIFVEHGVHFFDLLHAWLGEQELLDAWQLHRPQSQIIDQVGCDVRYGEQTTVDFYHGFHQPTPLDEQEVRLIFERGEVRLIGWIARELTLRAVMSRTHLEQLQAQMPAP